MNCVYSAVFGEPSWWVPCAPIVSIEWTAPIDSILFSIRSFDCALQNSPNRFYNNTEVRNRFNILTIEFSFAPIPAAVRFPLAHWFIPIIFHRLNWACCSSCGRENAPIECSPFRWAAICRATSLIRWTLDGLVHLWPSNNTWCCITHGDNVPVFPIDSHHVPVGGKQNAEIEMQFKTIIMNINGR